MSNITDVGYVRLSDGRDVCVEANSDGEINVTLITHDQPARSRSTLGHRIVSREQWNREIEEGKHKWVAPKLCVKCQQPILEPMLIASEPERCNNCVDRS